MSTEHGLPTVLMPIFEEYQQSGGSRSIESFIKIHQVTKMLTLSSVEGDARESAAQMSTLGVLMNVHMDDIIDVHNRDTSFLEEFIQFISTYDGTSTFSDDFLSKAWAQYIGTLKDSPNYELLRNSLIEEWILLIQSNEYASKINNNEIVPNYLDSLKFFSPNMHHTIMHVVDAMFSSSWNSQWNPALKRFSDTAQEVTRIANWKHSWKRELQQEDQEKHVKRDITSGVLAKALDEGFIDIEFLRSGNISEIIEKIENTKVASLEEKTVLEWLDSEAKKRINSIRAMDIPFTDTENYILGLTKIFGINL